MRCVNYFGSFHPYWLNEYLLWMSMTNDMVGEVGGGLPLSSLRVGFSCVFSDVKVILWRTYRKLKRDWFTGSCQICWECGLLYAANESLAGLFLNVCDLRNLGFVIYVFIVVARIFMFWSIDVVLVIVFVFAISRQVSVFWKTRQLRTDM